MRIDWQKTEIVVKGLFIAAAILILGLLLGTMGVLLVRSPWIALVWIGTLAIGFLLGCLTMLRRNRSHDGVQKKLDRMREQSHENAGLSP